MSRPVGMRVSQASSAVSMRRHQPVHVTAGQRRDVDPRRPLDLDEVALDLALEVVAALLVDQVPLVVGDDERAPGVDHQLDDPGVLLGQRLLGVDQDDRDLGLLQRGLGAQRRVVVGAAGLVHPAADARGVDEAPRSAAELDHLVDRVARGAGDVVDDDPVLAGELVEQAGLADVGLAEQRDPARTARGRGAADRGDRRAAPRGRRRAGRRSPGRAAPTPGTARRARGSTAPRRRPRRAGRRPCWPPARPACRRGAAACTTASSVSVAPTVASTTNSTASARSIAISACSATRGACPWRRAPSRRCRRR